LFAALEGNKRMFRKLRICLEAARILRGKIDEITEDDEVLSSASGGDTDESGLNNSGDNQNGNEVVKVKI
jgi:hypothetical protein